MLDIKDAQDNPIYEKSTNVFQDLYTPASGRVKPTNLTSSRIEDLGKSGIDLDFFDINPKTYTGIDSGANILDKTKEGAKSLAQGIKGTAGSAVEGTKSAVGSAAGSLLGKSLSIGSIGYGIANKDPYATLGGVASLFNPLLGLGIGALGMFNKSRRR